jgi:hypothetical protein
MKPQMARPDAENMSDNFFVGKTLIKGAKAKISAGCCLKNLYL